MLPALVCYFDEALAWRRCNGRRRGGGHCRLVHVIRRRFAHVLVILLDAVDQAHQRFLHGRQRRRCLALFAAIFVDVAADEGLELTHGFRRRAACGSLCEPRDSVGRGAMHQGFDIHMRASNGLTTVGRCVRRCARERRQVAKFGLDAVEPRQLGAGDSELFLDVADLSLEPGKGIAVHQVVKGRFEVAFDTVETRADRRQALRRVEALHGLFEARGKVGEAAVEPDAILCEVGKLRHGNRCPWVCRWERRIGSGGRHGR